MGSRPARALPAAARPWEARKGRPGRLHAQAAGDRQREAARGTSEPAGGADGGLRKLSIKTVAELSRRHGVPFGLNELLGPRLLAGARERRPPTNRRLSVEPRSYRPPARESI